MPPLSANLPEGSIIWAFEPNPRSYFLAQRTIALNSITNVKLQNAILSKETGELDLVVEEDTGRSLGGLSHVKGSGNLKAPKPGDSIKMRSIALDEVVPKDRDVSIIQLDIEGHELEALSGAKEIVARCKPILILEFVPDASDLEKIFPQMGFRAVGRLGLNTVFLPSNRFDEG
ncbi:MAG: FkbM family methyltransferase [Paracoccaceae bacterium]|nr:FkbM family methyltransferase [Paracoccaceae bacterium]